MKRSNIVNSLISYYGIQGDLTAFDSYDDEIYRVDSNSGSFILKVYHPDHDLSGLRMQVALMDLLNDSLSYNIPAAIPSLSGDSITILEDNRAVTLHPYLSGVLMGKANPILPSTRRSLGTMLGAFQKAVEGVRLKGDEYEMTWDNAQIDWIADRLADFWR